MTISRRGFLASSVLGAVGVVVASADPPLATALTRSGAASCLAMTPVEEVGPFYVDYGRVRSHIRGGQSGVPLTLHITVINVKTCRPVHNAALDIWQANALGVYSDESSEQTVGQTWLRGVQLTDKSGVATFHTIMPGWYSGRVNHIHAKVRVKGTIEDRTYSGGTTSHIGQMFFPQKVNNRLAQIAPYQNNQQDRITNATDRVYTQQGGASCRLSLSGSIANGYVGRITLGVKI